MNRHERRKMEKIHRMNNKQPMKLDVNLAELPYLKCPAMVKPVSAPEVEAVECGGEEFERVEKMRRMSPVMSPTGEVHYFIEWRYRCVECGALLPLNKDYPGCVPVMAQLAKR